MGNCIERGRTTYDTSYRIDSVHGECVRNLAFRCTEFETPTRTNPVMRNVANHPETALDTIGGHIPDGGVSLGSAYYPPKPNAIKRPHAPRGNTGKR